MGIKIAVAANRKQNVNSDLFLIVSVTNANILMITLKGFLNPGVCSVNMTKLSKTST